MIYEINDFYIKTIITILIKITILNQYKKKI